MKSFVAFKGREKRVEDRRGEEMKRGEERRGVDGRREDNERKVKKEVWYILYKYTMFAKRVDKL